MSVLIASYSFIFLRFFLVLSAYWISSIANLYYCLACSFSTARAYSVSFAYRSRERSSSSLPEKSAEPLKSWSTPCMSFYSNPFSVGVIFARKVGFLFSIFDFAFLYLTSTRGTSHTFQEVSSSWKSSSDSWWSYQCGLGGIWRFQPTYYPMSYAQGTRSIPPARSSPPSWYPDLNGCATVPDIVCLSVLS